MTRALTSSGSSRSASRAAASASLGRSEVEEGLGPRDVPEAPVRGQPDGAVGLGERLAGAVELGEREGEDGVEVGVVGVARDRAPELRLGKVEPALLDEVERAAPGGGVGRHERSR